MREWTSKPKPPAELPGAAAGRNPFVSNAAPLRLGILGGVGAVASQVFHERLLRAWAARFGCDCDAAYPALLHLSESLSGLCAEGLTDREAGQAELDQRMRLFQAFGAHLVVAPCNSLWPLQQALSRRHGLPVLTPWCALRDPVEPSVVLCSASMRALQHRWPGGLKPVPDSEQDRVQALIDAVIRADTAQGDELESLIERLRAAGAARVVLACTELSCIPRTPRADVVDTLDLLIAATLEFAATQAGEPASRKSEPPAARAVLSH